MKERLRGWEKKKKLHYSKSVLVRNIPKRDFVKEFFLLLEWIFFKECFSGIQKCIKEMLVFQGSLGNE